MEPATTLPDPGLAEIRERRLSLRTAMSGLESALATPPAGQIEGWHEAVAQTALEVQANLEEHVTTSEGPDGFHGEVLEAAPRLAHAVDVLVRDHLAATALVAKIVAASQHPPTQDVEVVREQGTELLALLSRHRQRGADLIYEAYEYDLGGED